MYFYACLESARLAAWYTSYPKIEGSPYLDRKIAPDLWKESFEAIKHTMSDITREAYDEKCDELVDPQKWGEYDYTWGNVRHLASKGMRNSLLIALMPTASTSQFLRNAETTEAHASNIYSRKVLSGEFVVVNQYMVDDFANEGIWNSEMVEYLKASKGSIQSLARYLEDINVPVTNRIKHLIAKYKTMYEISQKRCMQLARDRGIYIDQSQSLNVYMTEPDVKKVTSSLMYGWRIGLKTGLYYLRQQKVASGANFTLKPSMMKYIDSSNGGSSSSAPSCAYSEGCVSCSS